MLSFCEHLSPEYHNPPTRYQLALHKTTMPFPLPSIKHAQASPSLSLEQGSYRLRAPPSRIRSPSRLRTSKSQNQADASSVVSKDVFVPASYEKRMALLVALLACAMVASFGTAYYLWTTR